MALGKMALGKMAGWVKWRRVKWHWVKYNWVNCHVTQTTVSEFSNRAHQKMLRLEHGHADNVAGKCKSFFLFLSNSD